MAKGRDKLTSFIMQEEALINPERLYLSPARGAFVFGSHLHLQHLVENGLGETFVDVSLLSLLDQLVSVLFVWDDTPAASDLETKAGSAEVSQCFQTKVTRNYFNVSPQFLMFFLHLSFCTAVVPNHWVRGQYWTTDRSVPGHIEVTALI